MSHCRLSLPLVKSSPKFMSSVTEHFDGDEASILLKRINSNCWMDSIFVVFFFSFWMLFKRFQWCCWYRYKFVVFGFGVGWYTQFCVERHVGWNNSETGKRKWDFGIQKLTLRHSSRCLLNFVLWNQKFESQSFDLILFWLTFLFSGWK